MPKIDLHSTVPKVLEATVKKYLDNKDLFVPLSLANLLECVNKMPFSIHFYFNKLTGLWLVSNMHEDSWSEETTFHGVNFTIYDLTLEIALARAVHRYYHLKIKD